MRDDQRGPGAGTVVIEAQDLRKRYGPVQAVDGVSFHVERGEVFGMLGPNGAGKTTTVEMLEGLRKPDGGQALVLGIDVAREPDRLKERIGVQLQTAALYPNLTVTEVIDLFGSFYRQRRPTSELIEALDLGERRDALTKVLSGGQRQRLSVALALVNDPELIFLDEPTTGMDPAARRSLWDLVLALKERGTTVLLTTHYMEEAERLCDRIAIMDHGRILEMGTVKDLVERRFQELSIRFDALPDLADDRLRALPGVSRVVHEDGEMALYTRDVAATIGGLLTAARDVDQEPQNLAVRRATLEDVFLDLTGRALRD
ncbi:MAG: ABC transporter ATP-binding protein [Chloroflexota bacterium]|nr:ABC transporter ATP-binding protein [Chloroflexota bacterium]